MKRIVAWLVVLALFAGLGVPALAGEEIGISPMYANVSAVKKTLTFEDTSATCKVTIEGLSGTTGITAAFTLQRKVANGSYTTLKTWANQSATGTTLRFFETYTITKGYTYRLTVSASIARNGTTETISEWVENTP